MKRCPNPSCGKEIQADWTVCPWCGADLSSRDGGGASKGVDNRDGVMKIGGDLFSDKSRVMVNVQAAPAGPVNQEFSQASFCPVCGGYLEVKPGAVFRCRKCGEICHERCRALSAKGSRLPYCRVCAEDEGSLVVAGEDSAQKVTNSIGMEFVLIPSGSFLMGSKYSPEELERRFHSEEDFLAISIMFEGEQPRHRVDITKSFYMQTTPVTQGQWQSVMGSNPSFFEDCGADCPVEGVSWEDAQRFLTELNRIEGRDVYRLPTEAEWEYACRAGSEGLYCFGDDASLLGEYAWFEKNSGDRTHPVGRKRPNAWGIYDMHGNVFEWCQDWYDGDYYSRSPARDPRGPDRGEYRVVRGGSWHNGAGFLRSAIRNWSSPVNRLNRDIGFRVARITP